jgi:uncharacterized protein YndB with AHSA1/START domain
MTILFILFLLFVAVAVYAFFKTPSVVVISRSILIDASPEVLFPYINNPQMIQSWNPFSEGDPSVKLVFSGPSEGIDSQWAWEGKKAGAGQATIIESEKYKRVAVRLDFKKPFHVTNFGDYVLTPQGNKTEVRWTVNETAAIPRVLNNFVNLEKIIGTHFEKGLAVLKTLAEAKAKNN